LEDEVRFDEESPKFGCWFRNGDVISNKGVRFLVNEDNLLLVCNSFILRLCCRILILLNLALAALILFAYHS
jgi:hypothetical protein